MAQVVRIGLIGSGFVSNFYMQGLKDVAGHGSEGRSVTERRTVRGFRQAVGYP